MPELPQHIREELEALDQLRDEDIDFSDIPETTDWSNAVRGKFYRPVKESANLLRGSVDRDGKGGGNRSGSP